MKQSDLPSRFQIPFANNAGDSYIRTVPQAHVDPSTSDAPASLYDGFPPETFTSLGAGGIPPNGADMNGILHQITMWSRWQAMGGPTIYSSDFCTAIGGYPKGAMLMSTATAGRLWWSTVDDNMTDPDGSGAAGWRGLDAQTLNGFGWTSGQDCTFGYVQVQTPNNGTTGGLRVRGNPASGKALIQITDVSGGTQWGFWQHTVAGEADWIGGSGLSSNGSAVWHTGNLDPGIFAHISDFSTGTNSNGRWWRTPDFAGHSVLEQHGFVGPANPPGGQGSFTITFPVAFVDTSYSLQLTTVIPAAGDYDNFFQEISGTRTVNSVQVYSQDPSDGGLSNSAGVNWTAKGY